MMKRILTLLVLAALAVPMLVQSFGPDTGINAMHESWERQHLLPDHDHGHHHDAGRELQKLPFSMLSLIGDLLHLESRQAAHMQPAMPDMSDGQEILAVFLVLAGFHFIGLVSARSGQPNPRPGQSATDQPIWLETGRMRI